MIKLTEKTQQDFLNKKWVDKLLRAGVDMSDAKYQIFEGFSASYIELKSEANHLFADEGNTYPTYTVSELLYKLHEYIYPTINGVKYSGGLRMYKDAPFYPAMYDLKDKDGNWNEDIFCCDGEYPIESLAMLLIQCHKYDIGMRYKDVGNISSK